METCKKPTDISKEQALKARKILKEYERQERAKKKEKEALFACSAAVYKFLKTLNGDKDRDEWSEKDRKFYNNILAIERKMLKKAKSGQVDLFNDRISHRKHRWTVAMDNAALQGDYKFLEACGVTQAAIVCRRSRLMKNQPKKETANA